MSWNDESGSVHIGEGFYTEITSDEYTLAADEPVSVGGTDKGPKPYNCLLGALGS